MITPGAAMGITDWVLVAGVPAAPDSITATLYRWVGSTRSASGVTVTVAATATTGEYKFTWTNDGGWSASDELELVAVPVKSSQSYPATIWRSHGGVDAAMRGTDNAAQAGDAMTLTSTYDAAKTAAAAGAAMTLTGTTRVKLDATQPDYAPAKAGDEMTLDSATLTALFADVDTAGLVASIVQQFDEAADLPVQTIAADAASRTVTALATLISDAAAAKAAAEANQTTLAAVAASATTAATQATAAATSAASADGKLTTGRLAKIDGSAQTGADGDTLETLSDQIDSVGGGGGGSGDASQTTLLAVQTTVNGIATSLAGVSSIQVLSRVLTGNRIELTIGDDYRVRSGTSIDLAFTDVGGALATKLAGASTISWAAGANRQKAQIVGTITADHLSSSGGVLTVPIEVTSTQLSAGDADKYYTWHLQITNTEGDVETIASGELALSWDRV